MLPTALFLHIPRSGGTTLRRILAERYGEGARVRLNGLPGKLDAAVFAERAEAVSRDISLFVHGHPDRFFCYWQYLMQREHVKIVFMREPVSRVLSQYRYYRKVSCSAISLEEYLEDRRGFANYATRVLGALCSFDNHRFFRAAPSVDKAVENLCADNVLLGLTEEFDASLEMVLGRLGLDMVEYESHNRTRRMPDEGELDVSGIRDLYALDIELYKRARELFFRRKAEPAI